ncbi:hypothetical protein VWO34_09820, partial [Campylobacter coli]|nr:hypothetical protein [Campylobacter coli]
PRLFRLVKQESIQNAMGFNNQGAEKIAARLSKIYPFVLPLGARVAKLPKTQFCFPQPLVFQSLFLENKIKEENFCILEIKPQK